MALVDVTPPKLVQVQVDDRWYPGELRAWQKLDGRWRGDVIYTIDVGMRKLGSFDQDSVRQTSPVAGAALIAADADVQPLRRAARPRNTAAMFDMGSTH